MTAIDYLAAQPGRTRPAARFLHVVPLAFVTYGLAFLDRVNYGSAESRLRATLHLSSGASSNLAGLFFLGYFAFQIPGAIYASRHSVKPLIFWALIAWGLLSGLTGVLTSLPLLVLDRLLLGAVEGVVLPAMLIFLTRWFTKPERSRANALLILANPITMASASVLCGFLITYFDAHPFRHLAGWQMMFLVEGAPSLLWAGLWLWLADERPSAAAWLSPADASVVQKRLDDDQRGVPPVRNYRAAFADRRVILLSAMYLCFSAASYGFVMWLPQIVEEGTRRGAAGAGAIAAIPYLVAVFSMLIISYISDRSQTRKPFIWASMAIGCAAFCLAYLAGPKHFWVSFAALIVVCSCLYAPCGPLWAWMADMLPRNVVGESMALVNSFGALGGYLGTTFAGWLKNFSGSTRPAFLFLSSCFALAFILAVIVRSQAAPAEQSPPPLPPDDDTMLPTASPA